MYTIYKIINLKNDRYYIGCTSVGIKQRFQKHWGYRNPKYSRNELYADMNIQNREDFKIEIIVPGILNKDEAYQLEHDLTDVDDKLCYNQQRGNNKSKKHKDNNSKNMINKIHAAKKVQNMNTGIIYESATEASLLLGFKRIAVANAICQNYRCGGSYWKYIK